MPVNELNKEVKKDDVNQIVLVSTLTTAGTCVISDHDFPREVHNMTLVLSVRDTHLVKYDLKHVCEVLGK